MNDIVNDYFKRFYPKKLDKTQFRHTMVLGGMRECRDPKVSRIFPEIVCTDGFSLSVQGHYGAYSTPRDDFAEQYSSVEVGFPSAREELLMPYVEDAERPTNTVYAYVPVEIVVAVIEKHGGIKP